MGSVTQFNEKIRSVPPQLFADDDILTAARAIARRCGVATADRVHEAMSHSGLLSLSVPSDLGGADVTNDLLAQAVTIIAEADEDIAGRLADHFKALEFVRNAGSEDQRRALFARAGFGETFFLVADSPDPEHPVLLGDDLSFWVSDARLTSVRSDVDWIVMPALNYLRQPVLVVVKNRRSAAVETDLRVDDVLPITLGAENLPISVATLLRAAILLGQTQCILSDLIARSPTNEGVTELEVGEAYLGTELLKALIARVAAIIDAAQVGAEHVTVQSVRHSAAALEILMTRMRSAVTDSTSHPVAVLGSDLLSR